MTQAERFLKSRTHWPNVAGWGARFNDRTLLTHSNELSLPQSQIEQTVARLALAAESLVYHELKPIRLSWSFEKIRIYLGCATDGACLAIFVTKGSNVSDQELNDLLDQFALQSGT